MSDTRELMLTFSLTFKLHVYLFSKHFWHLLYVGSVLSTMGRKQRMNEIRVTTPNEIILFSFISDGS